MPRFPGWTDLGWNPSLAVGLWASYLISLTSILSLHTKVNNIAYEEYRNS